MATKERIEFKNFEDMASYVLANLYAAEKRWVISERTYDRYVDPDAGNKHYDTRPAYVSAYNSTPEELATYQAALKAWEASEPKRVHVTEYSLDEHSSSRFAKTIYITQEMFDALAATWKMGPMYRGSTSMKRVGAVTMAGMLKRLGRTNIKKEIESAEAAAKAKQAKNLRNNAVANITRLAQEIEVIRANHPEMVIPFDTRFLANPEIFKQEE